ncbi:MAG: helix-turn-helix domain-containing protein [Treponemataceae bacterium]|nr:helix-turn-helix domain-containing protein [Treponemataceae bacterium]
MESQELRECLSQNLKKYRKMRGWSQFDMAEKAQISEQTMSSIEGLRLWPSDKTLSKIATALDVEIYKLFVPQRLALQSESIAELKNAVVRTVEGLVHDTLHDWETQQDD